MKKPKVIFSLVSAFGFLSWLSLDSDVFARAGRGRSSGSRAYNSGGSYQRSPSQSPTPVQKDYQYPSQQPQPPSAGAGRSFSQVWLEGLGGRMLFRSLGFADCPGWGGGFGFGVIFLLVIILGIIYSVVKRFR